MKISKEKIREDVEDRLSELETYREGLDNLIDELTDEDLKNNLKYLIYDTDSEYEELEKRVEEYEQEDEYYMNQEYMRGAL